MAEIHTHDRIINIAIEKIQAAACQLLTENHQPHCQLSLSTVNQSA